MSNHDAVSDFSKTRQIAPEIGLHVLPWKLFPHHLLQQSPELQPSLLYCSPSASSYHLEITFAKSSTTLLLLARKSPFYQTSKILELDAFSAYPTISIFEYLAAPSSQYLPIETLHLNITMAEPEGRQRIRKRALHVEVDLQGLDLEPTEEEKKRLAELDGEMAELEQKRKNIFGNLSGQRRKWRGRSQKRLHLGNKASHSPQSAHFGYAMWEPIGYDRPSKDSYYL